MKTQYLLAIAAFLGISCLILMGQTTPSVAAQDNVKGSEKQTALEQPVELGKVAWGRNLQEAVAKSQKYNKPIALLFQEVPG